MPAPIFDNTVGQQKFQARQKTLGLDTAPAVPVAPAPIVPLTPDPVVPEVPVVEAPTPERPVVPELPTATTLETPAAPAVEAPPVVTPPVETPPVVTPPVEAPPAVEAPAAPVVETPAVTALTPLATDTPAVTVAKTQAQQDLDLITNTFREWATMKNDPSFRATANRNLMSFGLQSQAAADALQMHINQTEGLRGQPAGTALMQMAAQASGMQLSELMGQLTVAEADRVREMNKYGVDGLYKITQAKMTQDEKDADFYGTIFDRLISQGDEAGAEKLFNEKILPLLGDKGEGMTSQMFRSPAERRAILSGVETAGLADFRDALDRDDLQGALDSLEAAYNPAVQLERGKKLMETADVDQINQWLKDAGYDEITDMADLIGREDDVFIAQQVSKGLDKINENPLQPQIDSMLSVLQGRGLDITDPDVLKAVNDWVYNEQFGDPEQPNVLPWESDATSWQYKDWEIFDPLTGRTVDAGGQFYDPQDNPEPAPGSAAYTWKEGLDTAWKKYLNDNPDSKTRLSRDDWFKAFKKDYTDFIAKNPQGDLTSFFRGDGTAKPYVPTKVLNSDADFINAALTSGDLSGLTNDQWAKLIVGGTGYENAYAKAKQAGLISNYASKPVNIKNYKTNPGTHNIQNYKAAYSDLTPGSYKEIDGVPYRIEAVGVPRGAGSGSERAFTKVTNLKTGATEYILPSDKWDI